MKKIEFTDKDNIESIVYTLLAHKARGEKVYTEYLGHILYSDTVTMENAYKEINDNSNYARRVDVYLDNEKRRKVLEEDAREKIPEWLSKGNELISKDKHKKWKDVIMTRSMDLYHGCDLDVFLNIMKDIEDNKDMATIVDNYILLGYSPTFKAFVNSLITDFCEKKDLFMYEYNKRKPKVNTPKTRIKRK